MSNKGSGALLLVGGLGVIAALVAMSQSSKAEASPTPTPVGPVGPTGPTKPTDQQCVAMKTAADALVAKATAAVNAFEADPKNEALHQAAIAATQAATAASQSYAALCGPIVGTPAKTAGPSGPVTSTPPSGTVDWNDLKARLDRMGSGPGQGTSTLPDGRPLSDGCQSLLLGYQAVYGDAQELQALAEMNPHDTEAAQAAEQAYEELISAAQAYEAGCPTIPTIANWLHSLGAHPSTVPSSSTAPFNYLQGRWAPEGLVTTSTRAPSVPRLTDWPASSIALASSQGGACNGPDLEFQGIGSWPVVSNRVVLECQCDPVCTGADVASIVRQLDAWGFQLSVLVDSNANLDAQSVTTLTTQLGAFEAYFRDHAPGVFTRYLAALYALFAGVLGEPGLSEADKAVATHVVLVASKLLKSLGTDPARVPALPFVWVPRANDGSLEVPIWSRLNLFPGVP